MMSYFKKIIFSFTLCIIAICALGQSKKTITLSESLDDLAKYYHVIISHATTVTQVYAVRPINHKDIETDLQQLIQDFPLAYQKVDEKNYYVYTKESDKIEKSKITVISDVEENTELDYHPIFAVKSNLLYDVTGTASIGVEWSFQQHWSLDLSAVFNVWTSNKGGKNFKNIGIQPELRYWFCDVFQGSFVGLHAHYDLFNVGTLSSSLYGKNMRNYRYEGRLYGAGLSYGYHWILSNHWSLESVLGIGYAHIKYDKYPCQNCGSKIKTATREYVGPTKAAVNIIYMIK